MASEAVSTGAMSNPNPCYLESNKGHTGPVYLFDITMTTPIRLEPLIFWAPGHLCGVGLDLGDEMNERETETTAIVRQHYCEQLAQNTADQVHFRPYVDYA